MIPEEIDPVVIKIKQTIDFQQSYADELYRSTNGEDYDRWYMEWLRFCLNIMKEYPRPIKEKIVYRDVPTDKVVIQRIFQKKYIFKDANDIIGKLIKMCLEHGDIITDKEIKHKVWIDMDIIRKDLDPKDK